ncbi:CotH kinase family protein [Aeromicrobium sp.]|uniref:CotH kinase family protein n=1 Tax=Aeromicrobium sp. TaxID=1871063 RepID=UPI003D6A717B
MKTIKSSLVVILATFALLASLAAASTAVSLNAPPDNLDNDGADLTLRPDGGSYTTGETIEILANFQSTTAGHSVTLYKEIAAGSNTYEVDEVDPSANTNGNAYFHPEIDEGARKYYAEDDENGHQTEVKTLTGVAGPPPGTAVLDTSTDGGKTFAATFSPATSGQQTRLQVREICTYETNETDPETGPFDDSVSQKDCKGPWTTLDTGTQSGSGNTSFTVADPLEVKHTYRATSGGTNSNELSFAAPLKASPSTGLSRLHFNTYEGDSVNTRTRWFEGEFIMTGGTGCAATPTDQTKPMSKSRMKGRGNYSWTFEKKSYSLNIDKKTSLCGLGVSKKYALIANHYDKSLLRNSLAGYIGSKFDNMAWAPKSHPVDLFVNGSYRGSYLLIERISIQGSVQNATEDPPDTYADRVNIHELNGDDPAEQSGTGLTGGYVVEWDFRAADNDSSAPDTYMDIGPRGLLGIKEPEFEYTRENEKTDEGISNTQKNYITDYVNDCDNKLFGSNFTSESNGWKSCINQASAVDYYLAMEYLKPVDGNMWASVYMYKPREGKLRLGPLWDFDLAVGSANRAGNVVSSSSWYLKNNLGVSAQQSSKTWFNRLNEDPDFRAAVNARWNEVNGTLSPGSFLDTQKSILNSSATANYSKWGYKCNISEFQVCKGSFSSDVSYVRTWANGRKSWIDGQVPGS